MSNMYDLEKVDWSFEGSSRAIKSNKARGARRMVSNIITNTVAVRVNKESFSV